MAEFSYPTPGWNSRAVNDLEFEALTHPQAPDGLIGHPDDPELIYLDGTALKVRASRLGLLRGRQWGTDGAGKTLTPPSVPNGGTARVDLVVMRLTRSGPAVTVEIRQGTPGSGAPAAVRDLGTTGVYEMELAEATLAAGASTYSVVTPRAWYLGEDGIILCKSTTRPPHAPGRRIWETNNSRLLVSTGAAWERIFDESGITSITTLSGFTAPIKTIQRRNGMCVATLDVRRNGATFPANSSVKVGSVPDGFAPTFEVDYPATYPTASGEAVRLRVDTGGNVYVVTPAGLSVNADRSVIGSLTWIVAD